MTLVELLVFILVCYGFTQIAITGKIFDGIRPRHYYFTCAMCVGFAAGVLGFLAFWFCGRPLFPNPYVGSFLYGCLSSGTSYILCKVFDDDGLQIKIN
jgi:hypothetical protein